MESGLDRAIDFLEDLSDAIDYSVIGPRDNRIHEIQTTRFPFNTICHLERDFGDGLWRGCTGVIIGPGVVLTAAHCVYNHRQRRAAVRMRISPGRSDRDTRPYGSAISKQYYVPRGYVNSHNPIHPDRRDFDYGIISLPQPFQGIHEFMELRALSTPELEDLKHSRLVTIAGYPGDRPIGTLWRHSERLKRLTPTRLLYTVDTCPGHSGSPIWYQQGKKRYIIGIHTSGIVDELGRAYGCSKGTIIAPPGMMNSGIRLTHEVLGDLCDPNRKVEGITSMIRFP